MCSRCGIEKPLNCTGHVIAVVVESCDFAEDEAGGHEDACDGKIPGGCPGVMLSGGSGVSAGPWEFRDHLACFARGVKHQR